MVHCIQESSISLSRIPSKSIGPEGVLYVRQCEFAVVAASSGDGYNCTKNYLVVYEMQEIFVC